MEFIIFSEDLELNNEIVNIYNYFINELNNDSEVFVEVLNRNMAIFTNPNESSFNKKKARAQITELSIFQKELKNINAGWFRTPVNQISNNQYSPYTEIINTEVVQAEVILSNAYARKFGLSQNDFLGDIINNENAFFKQKIRNCL